MSNLQNAVSEIASRFSAQKLWEAEIRLRDDPAQRDETCRAIEAEVLRLPFPVRILLMKLPPKNVAWGRNVLGLPMQAMEWASGSPPIEVADVPRVCCLAGAAFAGIVALRKHKLGVVIMGADGSACVFQHSPARIMQVKRFGLWPVSSWMQ